MIYKRKSFCSEMGIRKKNSFVKLQNNDLVDKQEHEVRPKSKGEGCKNSKGKHFSLEPQRKPEILRV